MKSIFSHKYIQNMRAYAVAHKVISAIIIIAVSGISYQGYKSFINTSGETRYVLGTVQKGTIIVSMSGSGQVLASNQVDIKTKVSGEVIYVGVKSGQEVKAGALIAQLDVRDVQKTVRDAEVGLEGAKLQLEKLIGSEDLAIPKNKKQAQENLKKSYDDGFNNVANAFLDLPAVITGLRDILVGENFSKGQWNGDYFANAVNKYDEKVNQFKDDAYAKYQAARKAYDENFIDYKSASRFSDDAAIEALIEETYNTTKIVAEAVKSANNLIQFYKDKLTERNFKPETLADTFLSDLNGYTGKTNSHLLNLLNIQNGVKNYKDAVLNADLDIRSQELTVRQRENALTDAREKLADYFVRAPFDGTIAKLNVKKLDSVTSATVAATLITKQKFAEISLNEVDVAKIKVGQKVTLTFDALESLSIAGEVSEVDSVGTVSQGVVTYNIKIGFDTQDDRIKTGMSVNAAIVTDIKNDVLAVPNGAVKSKGNRYFVEILDKAIFQNQNSSGQGNQGVIALTPPGQQPVEIGLANDVSTEIISGLKEGDQIIVRTILPSTGQVKTQQAPSIFGATGGNRGGSGGGAIRISR